MPAIPHALEKPTAHACQLLVVASWRLFVVDASCLALYVTLPILDVYITSGLYSILCICHDKTIPCLSFPNPFMGKG